MPSFIKLAVTDLNDDGEPLVSDRDEWVNLDQVTSLHPMLASNTFRRIEFPELEEKHYPLIELVTADQRHRYVSLGEFNAASSAVEALHNFMPALTHPRTGIDVDAELHQLLGGDAGHS